MQFNLVNNEEQALYLWVLLFRVALGLALCCVLAGLSFSGVGKGAAELLF